MAGSNVQSSPKHFSPAEIEAAMAAPSSVFGDPEAVLAHDELTKEQKIEILRRWQYDAVELGVAVEEGMPGEDDGLLRRVMVALGELTGPVDVEHIGPTKQHGLGSSARSAPKDKSR